MEIEPPSPTVSRDNCTSERESGFDGLLVIDAADCIQAASGPALTALGFSPAQWIGEPLRKWFPDGLRGLRSGEPADRLARGADGVPVLLRVLLVEFALGTVAGRVLQFRVPARSERVEAAIVASERRLRLALDVSNLGVWEVHVPERRVEWDVAYGRLFGRELNQHPRSIDEFYRCVHPDDLPALRIASRRTVLEGIDYRCEFRILWPNGETRWHLALGRRILDEHGQPIRVIGVGMDITERKRLEDQLRQSQKMEAFGQLAGGIAHDFNNVLTIITGFAEVLQEQISQASCLYELATQIRQAAERAGSLTGQLLAFSRRTMLSPQILNLNRVVTDTEKMLRRLIGEDIRLQTILDAGLAPTRLDAGQVSQILVNLVLNARDAMPRGGQITIETRNLPGVAPGSPLSDGHLGEDQVALEVRDTGTGMTPEVQARIFEPFFTTKSPGEGTGLGLAVVHGIVEQSHGSIEVTSQPGRGSCFRICFPAVTAETAEAAPADRTLPARGNETILIAEDESSVRSLLRQCLAAQGYQVLVAENATAALIQSEQHHGPIDLLITDVVMPGMDGPELAREMQSRYPPLKVLFISGYTDEAIVRHGILKAEVAFLHKPFKIAELIGRVRQLLDAAD